MQATSFPVNRYIWSKSIRLMSMVGLDPINKVVKLLASAPSAEAIIDFRPSEEEQSRFDYLIKKKKTEGLTPDETREADNFLMAEHMIRMAKLYALEGKSAQAA
ncbi:hypothetical protein CEQ90_12840 [Lewinellaceae bacterium SD302]|nr:hypothetical protein CEQ90_12840 [Lewinellaceae bacterium SD302]